jgi:hypothetical protein
LPRCAEVNRAYGVSTATSSTARRTSPIRATPTPAIAPQAAGARNRGGELVARDAAHPRLDDRRVELLHVDGEHPSGTLPRARDRRTCARDPRPS